MFGHLAPLSHVAKSSPTNHFAYLFECLFGIQHLSLHRVTFADAHIAYFVLLVWEPKSIEFGVPPVMLA